MLLLLLFSSSAEQADFIRKELIQCALDAQKNSYAPYSHFNAAAAVLCDSGKIYAGVNVENASYPAGEFRTRISSVI